MRLDLVDFSGAAFDDLQLLDLVRKVLHHDLEMLLQTLHVVLDHDVPAALNTRHGGSATMMHENVRVNLVDDLVLKDGLVLIFVAAVTEEFCDRLIKVFFVVVIHAVQGLKTVQVFGLRRHQLLHEDQNCVVEAERRRHVVDSQLGWDVGLMTLFDLEHEQLFGDLYLHEAALDVKHVPDGLKVDKDLALII